MEAKAYCYAEKSKTAESRCDVRKIEEILFRHVAEQRKRCESMEVCQVGRRTEIAKLRALESVIQEARLDIEYIRWCKKNGH